MTLLSGRAKRRWARVDRHSRLQMAVSLAFVIALAMFAALLVSLVVLRTNSRASVDRTQQWLEISGHVNRTVSALESFDGSGPTGARLIGAQDQLGAAVSDADPTNSSGWMVELRSLLPSVQSVADSDRVDDVVLAEASDLAQQLEMFNSRIAVDSQRASRDSDRTLAAWIRWVLGISVLGVVVLAATVFRVVLPLNRSIRRSLVKLECWTNAAELETGRRRLAAQVADGLDAATSEGQAFAVIQRTMRQVSPDHRSEVLLADSSMAHMRAAVMHPDHGGPGCGVKSPWSCPAVRHGSTLSFVDSRSVRACPHLSRHSERCSAVCSPLVFMGNPIGVMHTTGNFGEPLPENLAHDMALVAGEVSARLGTLRAFARAELQAATDVLTGLSNRRASEDRMAKLVNGRGKGVIALIEVGGLMELNDAAGKEVGDRAIRCFAEILRGAVRGTDLCGRWAGAQFVLIVDDMPAAALARRVDAVRLDAIRAFEQGGMPGLSISYGLSDSAGVVDMQAILSAADEALSAAKAALADTERVKA